ncbi:hypothetical protein UFOVP75_186 [uncultured Caudovirales phage]|uniref:Uncharacterized protein n=1 Tax=uncultured Caudovirales phage TaxID=2100421 RepID=A0A6J5L2G6_9CAUD|nr:hypothetical protein UFOVP75_186 [uncultured Caudovirales phage]
MMAGLEFDVKGNVCYVWSYSDNPDEDVETIRLWAQATKRAYLVILGPQYEDVGGFARDVLYSGEP